MNRSSLTLLLLGVAVVALLPCGLFVGSVSIPAGEVWDILCGRGAEGSAAEFIVLQSRLPQAVTALLGGASLAVAGLLLQTAFRNPLAGPSILGITSGASLGVALVMLAGGGTIAAGAVSLGGFAATVTAAALGAFAVMGLLLMLSALLRNDLMLLITGIILGYLTSSVITLLNYFTTASNIQAYTMWGMGTFANVGCDRLPFFAGGCVLGLILAAALVKPLDLLLLGDGYARNLGVNLVRVRNLMLLATGILTAVVTAYCGPVSFIGLAVPHIARILAGTDRHAVLLPATMLAGGVVALGCNICTTLPSAGLLPLNALTPVVGAPVILYVILRHRDR